MGYACPVCSDPQADAGHLANHLAFTAMLGDDAHEAWLEDNAPGWADMGEVDLADIVVEHVEETAFPQVFEDTAGGLEDEGDPPAERSGALFDDGPPAGEQSHGHEHGPGNHHEHVPGGGREGASVGGTEAMDDEAEAILEEAREMTRRMLEDDGVAADDEPGSEDGTDADTSSDVDADNNE